MWWRIFLLEMTVNQDFSPERRLINRHIDGSTGKRPLTPVARLMKPPW